MKVVQNLPNVLTLSNLLMGTIAVLATFNHSFMLAVYLTGGCLVADILDGALARKLGVDGELGIQLDSLADVVSFGVLPALIVYHFPTGISVSFFERLGHLMLSATIAVSAGLRLARFNVDTRPREYFWGLATPAGAMLVAALGWSVFIKNDFTQHQDILNYISWILPVFLAISYQVDLKLPGLKSPKAGLWTMIVMAVLTVLGLFIIGPLSIALGIFVYVMAGVVNLVLRWY